VQVFGAVCGKCLPGPRGGGRGGGGDINVFSGDSWGSVVADVFALEEVFLAASFLILRSLSWLQLVWFQALNLCGIVRMMCS
jgi:hypothetical protein